MFLELFVTNTFRFSEDTKMKYLKEGKKISYKKIGENKYLVNLSTAYDNNCSEQETVEVTGEVLAVMLNYERGEKNFKRKERRYHRVDMPSNDYEAAKEGLVLPSAEDSYVLKEEKKADEIKAEEEESTLIGILSKLTKTERRRLYLISHKKLSYEEIAALDGVTRQAVRGSCLNAKRKIEPYSDFLQTTVVNDWTSLLICTKF